MTDPREQDASATPEGGERLPDPLGVAMGSIGAGAGLGAAVITAALIVLRRSLATAPTWVLPLVLFLGIASAGVVGWRLARAITDAWRHGVTAALGVFAALMLAAVAAPIDALAGRIGLLAYLVFLGLLATFGARTATHAAQGIPRE
ncbi:MAG TPA: hypothetical protein VJ992_01985 [Gemmatimonadales bacterium]|nr:hypothetical protein [Gemmatimonadales bacterium]